MKLRANEIITLMNTRIGEMSNHYAEREYLDAISAAMDIIELIKMTEAADDPDVAEGFEELWETQEEAAIEGHHVGCVCTHCRVARYMKR